MGFPRPAAAAAVAVLLMTGALTAGEAAPAAAPAPPVSFYRDVRPIFIEACAGCHQPAQARSGVVLTGHAGLLAERGGKKAVVVAGKPTESLLVEEVSPRDDKPPKMPKGRDPLSKAQVELIARWIAEGAKDDTPASDQTTFSAEHPPVYKKPPVVTSLDYSPDGALLAVSGYHEVILHKPDGSGIEARLVGLSERIESVVFSPDGKLLAVVGGSPAQMGELQVWDVEKRALKLSATITFDCIRGASWSPDGSRIAFGCADNSVRAVEALTGKQTLTSAAGADWVLDTAFSSDGSHLVAVTRDGTMKLIQVKTQQFMDDITSITPGAMKGGFMSLRRHPTKDELLVGGSDGEPKIYKMYRTQARQIGDDFNLLRKFDTVPGRVFVVRWFKDGNRVAVGSSLDGNGEVRVHAAGDGKLLWKLPVPAAVFALAVSPDGRTVAAGGFDGILRWIDVEGGKVLRESPPVPLSLLAEAGAAAGPAVAEGKERR